LELPNIREFAFKQITSGPRMGTMEIINFHPESGEPKEFFPSPPDETLTEDYSVVALKRGLNPAHSVLILAGATTIGTQAAVEYVCQQNSLEELLLRLSVSNSGELKPFEAVIRVKVAKGVPSDRNWSPSAEDPLRPHRGKQGLGHFHFGRYNCLEEDRPGCSPPR